MQSNPNNPVESLPARPQLFVDGQESASLGSNLLNLWVEETTAGGARCEAVFTNWGPAAGRAGFIYFDRTTLDFGNHLSVRIGAQNDIEIFAGRITAIEARYPESKPPEIMIRAEDRLQDLRHTRRTRTFEDVHDRDVIEHIAAEHGLGAVVDIDGTTHRILAQVNRSDLDFLQDRLRAIDAELWTEGDTLHAQARSRRNAGEVTLVYGATLKGFAVLADLSGQSTSLTVSGWDVNAKAPIEFDAGEAAIQAELDGAESGSSILEDSLGPRAETVVDRAPHDQVEAEVLAEAEYRRQTRRFLTGRGVCAGDGPLRVGTRLTLQGLGELFEGTYYVTQVRHSFTNQDGFLTQFSVERPGLGKESQSDAATTKISFRPGRQR
jgi:phage protein D